MNPRAGLLLSLASCTKVPVHDIEAGFLLADASWFAEEQTLFLFWDVTAEQGLSGQSVVEVRWVTDDGAVDWTPVTELEPVHVHVPVDCGATSLCGSATVAMPIEPRDVKLRLRYHPDGELALDGRTVYNVVGPGPAHTQRSLIVYGVFDETNTQLQWRARHQLPTLRNEKAESLGLRRRFVVSDQRFGDGVLTSPANPYGYGAACPDTFTATGFGLVATEDRARFDDDILPDGARDVSTVCATATVTDATGPFTTGAVAQKNPEVRLAFPELRSPARDATEIGFFLGPCDRSISDVHEDMLRQRLQLQGVRTTCIDDWDRPGFEGSLVQDFRDAIESTRPAGDDMVLVIALSQDEPGVSEVVEAAIAQVVPGERTRASPRLAGAYILDSEAYTIDDPTVAPVTLWCPAEATAGGMSASACAVQPDLPDLELGPFSFGTLPILPTRDKYLDFVDTYSVAQAGEVTELAFRVPEFSVLADHLAFGQFGVVTFPNNERIAADRADAFSYCVGENPSPVVFRSEAIESCTEIGLPDELCDSVADGLLPLEALPDWHSVLGETDYELGLFWEFPYLLRMEYDLPVAGSVTAFGFSVPFGIASPAEAYFGTPLWTEPAVPVSELTQCTRFCDHPTFDSAGVYHVTDPFRTTYAHACYLPQYPAPGDSGFPRDP
ncbi:MAG: hypothetical protein ABMA64_07175 [Myxococcota bacterium]